ncbi:hypothetical protein BS78_01G000400 [Paspalum vaginatum]|nr:hypothetical protein BS78_01G000400 [Paspalum vaginatum]
MSLTARILILTVLYRLEFTARRCVQPADLAEQVHVRVPTSYSSVSTVRLQLLLPNLRAFDYNDLLFFIFFAYMAGDGSAGVGGKCLLACDAMQSKATGDTTLEQSKN